MALPVDRAERSEPLNIMKISSSIEHASASEHTLSNIRKQNELQDLQDAEGKEERRKEWKARRLKAAQEENAKCIIKEPPPRGPRSLRVASLDDLPSLLLWKRT
jgi:hypothetical protein